jgi:hypothetical protein
MLFARVCVCVQCSCSSPVNTGKRQRPKAVAVESDAQASQIKKRMSILSSTLSHLDALDSHVSSLLRQCELEQTHLSHLLIVRRRLISLSIVATVDGTGSSVSLRIARASVTDASVTGPDDADAPPLPLTRLLSRVVVSLDALAAPLADWTAASSDLSSSSVSSSSFHVLSLVRPLPPGAAVLRVQLWPRVVSVPVRCSAAMATFLGVDGARETTRGDVLRAVHAYVQNAGLVDAHGHSVRCDRHLKAVFALDTVSLDKFAELIDAHLTEVPPASVALALGKSATGSAVVTLSADVPVHELVVGGNGGDNDDDAASARAQTDIAALMDEIAACDKRRRFYLDFAARPLQVLQELASSGAHDRALTDFGVLEPSDDTVAAMFADNSAAVDDAVAAYLQTHDSSRRVFHA